LRAFRNTNFLSVTSLLPPDGIRESKARSFGDEHLGIATFPVKRLYEKFLLEDIGYLIKMSPEEKQKNIPYRKPTNSCVKRIVNK
jgi:hypothetical protein